MRNYNPGELKKNKDSFNIKIELPYSFFHRKMSLVKNKKNGHFFRENG